MPALDLDVTLAVGAVPEYAAMAFDAGFRRKGIGLVYRRFLVEKHIGERGEYLAFASLAGMEPAGHGNGIHVQLRSSVSN